MSELNFGKRITHESYFNGALKSTKTEYSIPELIRDKPQALSELMKCMELISSKQTSDLTIHIKADPKTHEVRMITKVYSVQHK